ncbi:hypothetical protein FBU59_005499 [Linderina macrospora]|uniref:Uncharacterized protein n=1 Tax=Linderina macrospora TaxID=4868 RepID=A0ACC1J2H1_9FUNG|nr:hypothetical protein FBU59_005499 [Linderina macrospora]
MNDDQCDFEIKVEDPQNTVGALQPLIRAHSSVLAAGSDYFNALQTSNMTESEAHRVVLEDMPYGHVRRAIHFIYNNAVPNNEYLDNADDWLQLLDVAARLAIPRLVQWCQVELLRIAVTVGSEAHTFDTTDLVLSNEDGDATRVIYHNHPKVSFGDHMQLVQYPDPEYIKSIIDLVANTGADDLVAALQRLLQYYPIGVCEDRVRAADTRQFQGPNENRSPDVQDMMGDFMARIALAQQEFNAQLGGAVHTNIHHHVHHPLAHALGAMPGPVVHPPHIGVRDQQPMDELDEHEERDEGNGHIIAQQPVGMPPFRNLWMPGQVATTTAQNNNGGGDEEPPQPQPGPVPEPPTRTRDE